MSGEPSDLDALRRRLEEEEAAYAELLAGVDRLAGFALPLERLPDQPEQQQRLNEECAPPQPPEASGLGGKARRVAWDAVAPAIERQAGFNATLVRLLNGHLEESARLGADLRQLASVLVQYLQRVQPLVDAATRVASAQATTRSELVLEAFDRRLESLGRRLEGLLALRDRIEVVAEQVGAIRDGLAASPPPPERSAAVSQAAADAHYAAFEQRFRADTTELREKLAGYVELFRERAPVVDLGCGRGEFLELLGAAGIEARGVEANARSADACRERGLDVETGDLLSFLRAQTDGTLGGVFAAQVAEHLPPPVLQGLLVESHRCLRSGGRLVLETVNPRSVTGLLEVYNRDLTHEKPLHPETLRFLAAAAGFGEVRIELKSPVEPAARLQPVPVDGLPERAAAILNENVERLNGLLYGPQEYALIAER